MGKKKEGRGEKSLYVKAEKGSAETSAKATKEAPYAHQVRPKHAISWGKVAFMSNCR